MAARKKKRKKSSKGRKKTGKKKASKKRRKTGLERQDSALSVAAHYARSVAAGMRHNAKSSAHGKKKSKGRKNPCPPSRVIVVGGGRGLTVKGGHGHSKVSATSILKKVKGKRWACAGPVRSGCGGSGSRVLGKVR